ncbi:MAG TPA: ribonuclease HII [Bacteroidales bacterium]|nr:MAG: ribonuclease HII [Bacteroidetes bacterium GWE2_42_24]OFY27531.1 MAG: ribonuclease HII [Bacteroidetes bacterium GWF2_43_11]PKP26033.1 MAG: ribonuclease HII [Bacteroidetes bacterium HGW-Bacteroidetes-22]HAQ64989.1 ribonuclease HII [Bacteroidales bacterium]HBZ66054.1 ribonuclease HII [Bacteroidales bacterium]
MKPVSLLSNYSGREPEAGCDEAGRGCLMGPVFAAAVILPPNFDCPILNDSKQLTAIQRKTLRLQIEEQAIAWGVASVSHEEIDKINILQASIKAMHLALDKLIMTPVFIIVDGNRFKPWRDVPWKCHIKGDGNWMSIAAASILAKTHRDEWVGIIHHQYPEYDWAHNKGYATAAHIAAIDHFGYTEWHRRSFHLKRQTSLDLT